MLSIENLTSAEIPGLKALYENAFENSTCNLERMHKMHKSIKDDPDNILLVAKLEGQIVGSVQGIVCNELFGDCLPFMVVENVAVLTSYQRQGIARQLMIKLEGLARERGCTSIFLVSSEHRKGAHKLYESLGYGVDKVNGYRKRLK